MPIAGCRLLAGGLALALAATGCSEEPASVPELRAGHPAAAHDVVVQLIFGAEADLDLFVTDPDHEEVYFANSPSRLGGVFEVDRRCDDPAPRIETVRFSPAPAGRYRVSVDYPIRCATDVDKVLFRVIVEANGERQEVEGTAYFGGLEPIVLEFDARESSSRVETRRLSNP